MEISWRWNVILLGINKKPPREFLASPGGFIGSSFGNPTFSF